jgi:hypothetical protein
MVQFPRSKLSALAGASALLALVGIAKPALAEEPLNNLGPVGPREPILVTVGNQRVIAFYVPERGQCAVNTVMKGCRR